MAACACLSSILYQVLKDGFGGVFCYPDVGKTSRSIESSCEPYFISSSVAFSFLICSWIMISLIVLYFHKRRQKKTQKQNESLEYEKLEDDAVVEKLEDDTVAESA
jgi:cbb3-type cytochrome oxidase subunit 3